MNTPRLIAETADFAVLYKPPRMHTVPLKSGEGGSLLDWAAELHPEITAVRGKKEIEGGILHRLDYETRGLVLAAKNQRAFDLMTKQQEQGLFVKEYDAWTTNEEQALSGFPPPPFETAFFAAQPLTLESGFRAFGEGRKSVRPVYPAPQNTTIYRTEILFRREADGMVCFRLRLARGFRHQIRSHLAWLRHPIHNDILYGGKTDGGTLALEAAAISFPDPFSGEKRAYTLNS